jgi:hypothetical protein
MQACTGGHTTPETAIAAARVQTMHMPELCCAWLRCDLGKGDRWRWRPCLLPPHLGLCCCAVFVGATDKDYVVAPAAAVACIAVCTQHAADDVAKVGHVVHVRQR